MHKMVFAWLCNWAHALQTFVVLQEWGSPGWPVLLILNCSPHILPCVSSCIICDTVHCPDSIWLPSAPLACYNGLVSIGEYSYDVVR